MSFSRRSIVWDYFTLHDGTATCNICKTSYKYHNTTSTLQYHLKRKHFHLINNVKPTGSNAAAVPSTSAAPPSSTSDITSLVSTPKQEPLQQTLEEQLTRKRPYPKDSQRVKELDKLVLKMVCTDLQPFSVVDDEGFKELVELLDPRYTLPSRTSLSTSLLPKYYKIQRARVQNDLDEALSVSLTTDIWTSRATQGYLTTTAHCITASWELKSYVLSTVRMSVSHTGEHIADVLRSIAESWGIGHKIQVIVTDNAANMVKAVRSVPATRVSCFAHTLNLIVDSALTAASDLEEIRTKVRGIVTFFHHSCKASDLLTSLQESSRQAQQETSARPSLKLIQEVSTRWNSTYLMFERYIKLHNEVTAALTTSSRPLMCVSDAELDAIKQAVVQLKPFYTVTTMTSGEYYMTMSSILPLVTNLQRVLMSQPQAPLRDLLFEQLQTRFQDIELNFEMAATTFLDPRFKQHAFVRPSNVDAIKKKLMEQMTPVTSTAAAEPPVSLIATLEDDSQCDIWASFDKNIDRYLTVNANSVINENTELRRFSEEPPIRRHQDPLKWWSEHAGLFPQLGKLAKKLLSIPATSVPSERLFSVAGELVSSKRANLSDEKIDMILFLNKNRNI